MKKLLTICVLMLTMSCVGPSEKYVKAHGDYFTRLSSYTIQGIENSTELNLEQKQSKLKLLKSEELMIKLAGGFGEEK